MGGAFGRVVGCRMTDNTNSDLFRPEDIIEQATSIIMDRFDLNAAQALEVLRRMALNTRTQMCVIAEQIIDNNVPVEAVRGLEEDVLGIGVGRGERP
jgi:ANTAR domain